MPSQAVWSPGRSSRRFRAALRLTHSQLLLLRVYACDAVCKGRDAWLNPVAGCEPLRSPLTLLFLVLCACAPLDRARAKNRGPLQAVPVMARAMAERLG